jgi:hypothetical protein
LGIDAALAARMVAFVDGLRALDLRMAPSISQTIDWARALVESARGLLLSSTRTSPT